MGIGTYKSTFSLSRIWIRSRQMVEVRFPGYACMYRFVKTFAIAYFTSVVPEKGTLPVKGNLKLIISNEEKLSF